MAFAIVNEAASESDADKAIGEFVSGMKRVNAEMAQIKTRLEEGLEGDKGAIAKAEKVAADIAGLRDDLLEVKGRIAETVSHGSQPRNRSFADMVFADEQFARNFAALQGRQVDRVSASVNSSRPQANTISGQDGSGDNETTLNQATRYNRVVPLAFRQMRIADLLNSARISTNSFEFVKESTFTNAAAETAEAAAKPQATLEFALSTVQIRTIAHWIKATVQILDDAPFLRDWINTRLVYGVNLREDAQLVSGNGTGQNISGMLDSGNFTAYTPVSSDTAIDTLNKAKYAIIGADFVPNGILLNPTNWGEIERIKTVDGEYVVGNAFGTITPMMWGMPVAVSNNMTAGQFLMADFNEAYLLLDRQETRFEIGFINDDFTKNLITMRAEKRLALATLNATPTRSGPLTI